MPQKNTEVITNTLGVEETQKTERRRLTDRDYFECVTKRGLNPEWIEVNCRSMSIPEATARLGYTAKSAGIWLESVNGFGQFRPNNPWKNDSSEKKAPKYRTATGEKYDALLPRHPHNPRYWEEIDALKALAWQIDGYPCLLLTEGIFKAIAGCSNDIPTVAIAGVQQGLTSSKDDPQGKRYLVETLERLCRLGFGWIIAFDADAVIKKEIRDAQRTLAHQLAKFKVPVYITELEKQTKHATNGFVMGTLNLLKAKLRVNDWEVVPGLLCLEDCVVDIHTLETFEHEPGYRFLSRLPFKWSDKEIGCEPIKQWLKETCGNQLEFRLKAGDR